MEFWLENSSLILFSWFKDIFNVKYSKIWFLPDKAKSLIIPHFHVILTGKSFYGIMFVIQGDLQGQF